MLFSYMAILSLCFQPVPKQNLTTKAICVSNVLFLEYNFGREKQHISNLKYAPI